MQDRNKRHQGKQFTGYTGSQAAGYAGLRALDHSKIDISLLIIICCG